MDLVKEDLGDVFQPRSEEEQAKIREPHMVKDSKNLKVFDRSKPNHLMQRYTILDDGDGEWRDEWEYLGFDTISEMHAFRYDENYHKRINITFVDNKDIPTHVMEDIK